MHITDSAIESDQKNKNKIKQEIREVKTTLLTEELRAHYSPFPPNFQMQETL